jgi:hypothetical protein
VDPGLLDVLEHATDEQLVPSKTASTSTSMAPSRKRSTRIGWSGEGPLIASAR